MAKKTIRDIDWSGQRALVRVDFNVPFERGTTRISDDSRIRAAVPTINYLREHGAGVVLCTHLGRPGGKPSKEAELGPIAERLSSLLGAPVTYVHAAVEPAARERAEALKPGEVLLLENIRFYPGEERNDPAFAKSLARLGTVYVNDAFGTAHRAHASTEGVARHLPAVAGFVMEREIRVLGGVLDNPERPLGAILGGAKVSDKLKVLQRLVGHVDALFIGGGMAATFLKAEDHEVGASLVEESLVDACAEIIEEAEDRGTKLYLPVDVVVAQKIEKNAPSHVARVDEVDDGWMILDIGPQTAVHFSGALSTMRTVVWNGPMGVFEVPLFDEGTRALAEAIAASSGTTIIGGGSTAEAVEHLGLADRMTHVSTGGGASLEFLEGKVLPGVAALNDK
ncbi:MAG: phosphoglycerate kinase [SAR202 cluster bacterium]|nr:phosphoglycerate kinase [SAR202 cluster bacterium]